VLARSACPNWFSGHSRRRWGLWHLLLMRLQLHLVMLTASLSITLWPLTPGKCPPCGHINALCREPPSCGVVLSAPGSLTMRTRRLVVTAVLVLAAGLAACSAPGPPSFRSVPDVASPTARALAVASTPRPARSTVIAPVRILPASPSSARLRLRYVT